MNASSLRCTTRCWRFASCALCLEQDGRWSSHIISASIASVAASSPLDTIRKDRCAIRSTFKGGGGGDDAAGAHDVREPASRVSQQQPGWATTIGGSAAAAHVLLQLAAIHPLKRPLRWRRCARGQLRRTTRRTSSTASTSSPSPWRMRRACLAIVATFQADYDNFKERDGVLGADDETILRDHWKEAEAWASDRTQSLARCVRGVCLTGPRCVSGAFEDTTTRRRNGSDQV